MRFHWGFYCCQPREHSGIYFNKCEESSIKKSKLECSRVMKMIQVMPGVI